MPQIRCSNCGTELGPSAQFCTRCGHAMSAATNPQTSHPRRIATPENSSEPDVPCSEQSQHRRPWRLYGALCFAPSFAINNFSKLTHTELTDGVESVSALMALAGLAMVLFGFVDAGIISQGKQAHPRPKLVRTAWAMYVLAIAIPLIGAMSPRAQQARIVNRAKTAGLWPEIPVTSRDRRFQVLLPCVWQTDTELLKTVPEALVVTTYPPHQAAFMVTHIDRDAAGPPLTQQGEGLCSMSLAGIATPTRLTSSEEMIGGRRCVYYEYVGINAGSPTGFIIILVEASDRLYGLVCWFAESHFDSYRPVLREVAESFLEVPPNGPSASVR